MQKLVLSILFSIALVFPFCECQNSGPPENASSPVSKIPLNEEYIEVSALGALEYFYDHQMGLEMAEKYLGVKTRYLSPPDYDINAMITFFEQAIAMRPAGILVVGFEESLTPLVNKAVESGIPVVTLDSDLPDSKRLSFVGTGNHKAGFIGGQKLGEIIGGKGQVALITLPGQPNLEERMQGYRDALSRWDAIEVVQVVDCRSDPIIAAQAAAAVLQKYPDLAGFGCVETVGGVGAATAVREARKIGQLKIVAMDRTNDVLQGIKDGIISATVVQQTALMPFYGVQMLYNYHHSPLPISTDNEKAGLAGIPSFIDTGVILVTKENCDYYIR